MSSESINQTPHELKTAVSELTRNISRLAVAQTNSTVLHINFQFAQLLFFLLSYIANFPAIASSIPEVFDVNKLLVLLPRAGTDFSALLHSYAVHLTKIQAFSPHLIYIVA